MSKPCDLAEELAEALRNDPSAYWSIQRIGEARGKPLTMGRSRRAMPLDDEAYLEVSATLTIHTPFNGQTISRSIPRERVAELESEVASAENVIREREAKRRADVP